MGISSVTAIDFFSGVGGASLGLQLAGCKIVGAVDNDPIACEYYEKNLSPKPICGDLRYTTGKDILDNYGLSPGDVQICVGCPPCQGFSSLRRTRYPSGSDLRKGLLGVFIERINEIWPSVVIFENVPGIARGKMSTYFRLYLFSMTRMGYETSWKIVNAADYGVPQHRTRVVAFSVKSSLIRGNLTFPDSTHANPRLIEKVGKKPWKTVRDSIADLPKLEAGEADPKILNHKAHGHSERVMSIIRSVPKDGGSRKDLPDYLWLDCHKRLANRRNKEKRHGAENVYGRMWWGRTSPTITCRCTTPSCGRFLHPEQDRAITPREAARLQTFPDDSVFPGNFTQAERCIGNAVPVGLISTLWQKFVELNKGIV